MELTQGHTASKWQDSNPGSLAGAQAINHYAVLKYHFPKDTSLTR